MRSATIGMVKKDEKWQDERTPTWLYETLHRLIEGQKSSQVGMASITRGEAPDGSGNPLIDTSQFFFKPGLAGDQVGFGGTKAAGTLTFSSTKNSTKGFIYLGLAAPRFAYDETNAFLGIGTDTPDAPLHVHRTGIGSPAIGSFGNEVAEFSTIVSAVETELIRIVPYQNVAGRIDAAILCNTGAAASGGLYFSSISGQPTGVKMSNGTLGSDTLNAAHLQFGGLNAGGSGINLNGVLCGINDIAGNSLRTAFSYVAFRFLSGGAIADGARVGVNVDPFDFSGSAAASQPDALHVVRRSTADGAVPTLLVEGPSATTMAVAIKAGSAGTTPNRTISANNLGGLRSNGDLILADAGTLRCLLSGLSPGGSGTTGFRFIETAGSLNLLRGGKISAWSDSLTEAQNTYLMLGDVNTHRAGQITSTGFVTFTRLGIASTYTVIMNAAAASLQAPEVAPANASILRVINSNASGVDTAIVLKLEAQRTNQSGDFLEAVNSNTFGVLAAIQSDGTYYGPTTDVFYEGDAVSYDDDNVFYHPTYR
jgi:hypothetical protein